MIRAVCLCLLLASPLKAQESPAFIAQRASGQLEAAAGALEAAQSASDRVAALTRAVRAYEEGLSALREGLRRAAEQEAILSARLEARRDDVARLLGALSAIERSPAPLLLLHPTGPLGTARSGMIMSEITPALQAEAEALRAEVEEIQVLRVLQEVSKEALKEGLVGVQDARSALSQAVAARTDLPLRFSADPDQMRRLVSTAETLAGFANGLGTLGVAPGAVFETLRGSLPMPVSGRTLRGFEEADAAGVARPGWLIATLPGALVTTPAAATIRYVGPLLDYGNVIVLEPADNTLLVLAGLGTVYGEVGEVISRGAPLGLMTGAGPDAGEFAADPGEVSGARRTETLYMELRREGDPVDPGGWFAPTRN